MQRKTLIKWSKNLTHKYRYKHTMAQVQYLNNSYKNYYTIYAQSQRPRGNLDKGGQQLRILIYAAHQVCNHVLQL